MEKTNSGSSAGKQYGAKLRAYSESEPGHQHLSFEDLFLLFNNAELDLSKIRQEMLSNFPANDSKVYRKYIGRLIDLRLTLSGLKQGLKEIDDATE